MTVPIKDRVAKCRARQKRVELLFRLDEFKKIEKAAAGQAISTFIKSAIQKEIEQKTPRL
ncbi:MAG: hypothetical protein IJ124_06105 [Clostridia bacterium]|nr:hypothetical protein [Clostridia bacterium]